MARTGMGVCGERRSCMWFLCVGDTMADIDDPNR